MSKQPKPEQPKSESKASVQEALPQIDILPPSLAGRVEGLERSLAGLAHRVVVLERQQLPPDLAAEPPKPKVPEKKPEALPWEGHAADCQRRIKKNGGAPCTCGKDKM